MYYHYDKITKEFIYSSELRIDKRATEQAGKTVHMSPPGFATTIPAPTYGKYQIPIWDAENSTWEVVEDYRDATVYDEDGNLVEITTIGPLTEKQFLSDVNLSVDEKISQLTKRILAYSEVLKSGKIIINNIPFNVDTNNFLELQMEMDQIRNSPYRENITGSVVGIDYSYNTDYSTITITTGTPTKELQVTNIIELSTGELLEISSIENNNYYIEDAGRPTTSGERGVENIYIQEHLSFLLPDKDGDVQKIKIYEDFFEDITSTIIRYKKDCTEIAMDKINELPLVNDTDLDNYDVYSGWPVSTFSK